VGYLVFNQTLRVPSLFAFSEHDQRLGLMFRKEAAVMSFCYEFPAIRKFWMKNTYLPLDILFCRAGEILAIDQGSPLSLDLVGPDLESDLIIELPQGLSRDLGLKIGTKVSINHSIISLSQYYERNRLQKI